jgi:hypothetical protein
VTGVSWQKGRAERVLERTEGVIVAEDEAHVRDPTGERNTGLAGWRRRYTQEQRAPMGLCPGESLPESVRAADVEPRRRQGLPRDLPGGPVHDSEDEREQRQGGDREASDVLLQ